MKFNDFKYERPDFEQVKKEFESIIETFKGIKKWTKEQIQLVGKRHLSCLMRLILWQL